MNWVNYLNVIKKLSYFVSFEYNLSKLVSYYIFIFVALEIFDTAPLEQDRLLFKLVVLRHLIFKLQIITENVIFMLF